MIEGRASRAAKSNARDEKDPPGRPCAGPASSRALTPRGPPPFPLPCSPALPRRTPRPRARTQTQTSWTQDPRQDTMQKEEAEGGAGGGGVLLAPPPPCPVLSLVGVKLPGAQQEAQNIASNREQRTENTDPPGLAFVLSARMSRDLSVSSVCTHRASPARQGPSVPAPCAPQPSVTHSHRRGQTHPAGESSSAHMCPPARALSVCLPRLFSAAASGPLWPVCEKLRANKQVRGGKGREVRSLRFGAERPPAGKHPSSRRGGAPWQKKKNKKK